MKPNHYQPLPPSLRERAEHFFGTRLPNVRLSIGEKPAALGAKAYARGNQIHLLPRHADFSHPENLALMGHELTHVLQQRSGRPPERPQNTVWKDRILEDEADDLGRRFAYGLSPGRNLNFTDRAASPTPVIQRAVELGVRPLTGIDKLSKTTRLILALIPDGIQWINWAISDNTVNYKFANEDQLLEVVQLGIHGTPLLLIRKLKLLVNPIKLSTYSVKDLQRLVRLIEDEDDSDEEEISVLLMEWLDLLNQDILDDTILQQVPKVAGHAVFQAVSLNARIAIWNADNPPDNSTSFREEAAHFAVDLARSPAEYADYYQYYISLVGKHGKRKGTRHQRFEWAREIIQVLNPMLFNSLRCPVLPNVPDPARLQQDLRTWYGQGFTLGFSRISHACAQLAVNTNLGVKSCINLYGLVQTYQDEARDFLLVNEADEPVLGQDGLSRTYQYNNDGQSAVLTLDPLGCLTLTSFTPEQFVAEEEDEKETVAASA